MLASGDHHAPVASAAEAIGIGMASGLMSPVDKVELVEGLRRGRRVLMVGDGLNDGPALAAASVSLSPATAADISQNIADVVFQGKLWRRSRSPLAGSAGASGDAAELRTRDPL